MDVYGDKRGIIADCVDEIQPFIDEVLGNDDVSDELQDKDLDIVIDVEEYLEQH